MKRSSIVVKIARLIQTLPLSFMRVVESPVVALLNRSSDDENLVILVALPRSGSTLTYQALVHTTGALYLSNLWNLLYAIPFFGAVLSGRICKEYRSNFKSDQGFVGGACGPAEGLQFWSYWLGNGIDDRNPPKISVHKLHNRINYIRKVFGVLSRPERPIVTGYIGHTLKLEELRSRFPNAVFVCLRRDPLSTASSILNIRKLNSKSWFSVFPKECNEYLNSDIYEQIASQVYWLNRRLDRIAEDPHTVHVAYESLCQDPGTEIERIVAFLNQKGMSVEVRRPLPDRFQCRLVQKEDGSDISRLAEALGRLEKRFGKLSVARYSVVSNGD
ncbi:MAG: sulfotransferase [Oceanospirillaceae bacterium]|nr:sulfotransferase [Oceanospirillaceae bacterium]